MDHKTIVKVLSLIRPGSEWNVRAGVIEWLDKVQVQPTDDEMAAGLKQLQGLAYQSQRAAAYPSIGDQLDALWKGGADAQAMGDQIRAIKAQFPKPV